MTVAARFPILRPCAPVSAWKAELVLFICLLKLFHLYSYLSFFPVRRDPQFNSVVKCFKVLLAAVDFELLTGAQIHKAVAALGFEDEIELFLAVLGQIDGPVRVIRSDGSVNLEPIRDLEEHLDVGVVVQGHSKRTFDGAAVIDDVIIDYGGPLVKTTVYGFVGAGLRGRRNNLVGCFVGCSISGLISEGPFSSEKLEKCPKSYDFWHFSCERRAIRYETIERKAKRYAPPCRLPL